MQAPQRTDVRAETRGRKPAGRRWMTLLLVPVTALVLAACADNSGMSDEDATAIREQIEEVVSRLDAVEERLNEVGEQDGGTVLISDVQDVGADVSAAKNMLNDVSQQLADAENTVEDDMTPAGDPLNDPLNDSLDDPLDGGAEPGLGDDLNQGLDNLEDNVNQGMDNLEDNVNEGLDNLEDNANDSLNDLNDGELDAPNDGGMDGGDPLDSDPLEDPLVPAAEVEEQPAL